MSVTWATVYTADYTGTDGDPWPAEWTVQTGTFDINGDRGRVTEGGYLRPLATLTGEGPWTPPLRVQMTFEMDSIDTPDKWFRLRYLFDLGSGNGYRISQVLHGDLIELDRIDAGTNTEIDNGIPGYGTDFIWHVDVQVTDEAGDWRHRLWTWPDGDPKPATPVMDVIDNTYVSGSLQFELFGPIQSVYVHELVVSEEGVAVTIPPPVLTEVPALSSTQLQPTWEDGQPE